MKRIFVGLIFFIAILATSWSLLHSGFFRPHDYVHAARIVEMLRGLQDGQFPVRWSQNFGFGYGMPLFEFYAPLPYFVGAVLFWSGLDIILILKLIFALTSVVSFLGMYKVASRLFGRVGGVVSALAFTLAPYRAVNLFVRGALSESWGMMALPWILLGIVKILRKEKHGWITLLVSLCVLLLSHNITTLLFVPVSGVFALVYWGLLQWHHRTSRTSKKIELLPLLQIGAVYGLAIALCAFYIFPAFLEKEFTKVDAIFSGYFYYAHHFLYFRQFFTPNWGYGGSVDGPEDGLSFFLGYGQLLGAGLSAIVLAWSGFRLFSQQKKKQFQDLRASFFLRAFLFFTICALLAIALFMTTYKSQFIWDKIPFMVAVQFPWRWLSVAATLLALLAGFATVYLPRFWRYVYVVVIGSIIVLGNAQYFRPEAYLEDPNGLYYTDASKIRSDMSSVLPDYIPKQMPDQLTPPAKLVLNMDEMADNTTNNSTNQNDPQVLLNRSQESLIQTHSTRPATLSLAIADFPGWTVSIDGQQVEKKVDPDQGNILVDVPAGEHLVGVQFGETPLRLASDAVSACAVLIVLFLLIQEKREVFFRRSA